MCRIWPSVIHVRWVADLPKSEQPSQSSFYRPSRPRQKSGPDCLTCSKFAEQRTLQRASRAGLVFKTQKLLYHSTLGSRVMKKKKKKKRRTFQRASGPPSSRCAPSCAPRPSCSDSPGCSSAQTKSNQKLNIKLNQKNVEVQIVTTQERPAVLITFICALHALCTSIVYTLYM